MKIQCPGCLQVFDIEMSYSGNDVECSCGRKFKALTPLSNLRILSIQSLEEYVAALQSTEYESSEEDRISAEKALAILDPQNSLIKNMLYQNNILDDSKVSYIPEEREFLVFPDSDNLKTDTIFFGKCVLFTGFSSEEKKQIAKICNILEITQPSSVCKKMDFLICGRNAGPSKIQDAKKLGKIILDIKDFFQEISVEYQSFVIPEGEVLIPEKILYFNDYFLDENYRETEIVLPSSDEVDCLSVCARQKTAFIGIYNENWEKIQQLCKYLKISARDYCDDSANIWVYSPNVGRDYFSKIQNRKTEGKNCFTIPEWIDLIKKVENTKPEQDFLA